MRPTCATQELETASGALSPPTKMIFLLRPKRKATKIVSDDAGVKGPNCVARVKPWINKCRKYRDSDVLADKVTVSGVSSFKTELAAHGFLHPTAHHSPDSRHVRCVRQVDLLASSRGSHGEF
eukprot:1765224-Amphidinium_carterae.1